MLFVLTVSIKIFTFSVPPKVNLKFPQFGVVAHYQAATLPLLLASCMTNMQQLSHKPLGLISQLGVVDVGYQ